MATPAYWVGNNGNVYVKGTGGKVTDMGKTVQGPINNPGIKGSTSIMTQKGGTITGERIANPSASAAPKTQAYNGASGGSGRGGGGGGSSAAAQQAAKEKTAQNTQLSQIDRLLGILGSQESQGMSAIESGYGSQKQRLTEQEQKAMAGYQDQFLKNDQNKQKGVEQVDDFANTSYNSLQSLLRGANAGVSSVGRQLVPHVVAKGAGTRRKDVFDTAGENTQAITSAKGDAEDQFRYGFEDLGNQRNDQIKNLRQGINQQAMDLEAQKMMLQAQAGNATDATARSLDARAGTLQSLFGQYAPSYTAKAMNLKTPELGQYQLDPGAIRQDQSLPAETRAYMPGIDRRRERELGA